MTTTRTPTTRAATRRRPLWRAVDLSLVALLVAIGGLLAVRAAEGAAPWSGASGAPGAPGASSDARPVAAQVPRSEALAALHGDP